MLRYTVSKTSKRENNVDPAVIPYKDFVRISECVVFISPNIKKNNYIISKEENLRASKSP